MGAWNTSPGLFLRCLVATWTSLSHQEPPGHLCLDSPAWRVEPGLQPGVPRHRAGTFANEVYGTADLSKRGASRWEEVAVAQLGLRACPGAAGSH